MLDYVIQCIEYLGKESDVLAEINKKAAHEGSTLREQLSSIDTHKAALEVVDALDNLGIMDEVLDTMAIDPFRADDFSSMNNSVNCSKGANKYLDRLKAGGDAVANGYGGHIDPKKVELDSGDGTTEAKLDKESISKAMAKVLLEDKDTPLVYIKLKDGVRAYIQTAGYEDNQLVADGNFDKAKIYVAMYDKNYKPILVNGKEDNKISGSEVVDYIMNSLSDARLNSSVHDNPTEMNTDNTRQFEVYYEDENGNECEEPIIVAVDKNLEGVDLYEAITDEFYDEMGPGYYWNTISSVDGDVELNSSVHDNPALKTLVEKIRPVCSQVSAIPTTENGIPGYKLIIRGAQADDIEPFAKEQGIEFSSLKPLEDGFAVTITADALADANVDPNAESSEEGALRYRDYLITGNDKGGYVAISPYGKFSPKVYKSIDEAKAAIDADMKVRFPET